MIKRINENKNENEIKDSNLEVMNYLIQKLDSRKNKIVKFKDLFKELDSFESFYAQRKEIYILLNNLEEDLKQTSFAIKALVIQNKALLKEINIKINENKIILNKLNFTIGENQNLKSKLNNINENIIYKMPYRNNNNNINSNANNINLLNANSNSIKAFDEEEYDEPKIKILDMNEGIINHNTNNFGMLNKYEQLSNAQNIMKEMRKNKKVLKSIIDNHFKEQKINY